MSKSPSTATLYYFPFSQPSRAVLQLLVEGGVKDQYQLKEIDINKKENLKPTYLAINPCGLVPALVDQEFYLHESNAILIYLVAKHNLTTWYPSEPQVRAKIDEYLYWSAQPGNVRDTFTGLTLAALVNKDKKVAQQKFDQIPAVMIRLEQILSNQTYLVTADHPTIADLQLYHEIAGPVLAGFGGFNLKAYPKTLQWLHVMSSRKASKEALGKFGSINSLVGKLIWFGGVFTGNKLTL